MTPTLAEKIAIAVWESAARRDQFGSFESIEFWGADELAEHITRALAALPQAPLAQGWIPCSERMPPIDRIVIIDGGIAVWRGGHWDSITGHVRAIEWKVTHWQPLPILPTPPALPASGTKE